MATVHDLRFLSVDDLTQGLHEWRNIQEIVRQTFRGFYDVIRAQGETIVNLQLSLEQKPNRSELQTLAVQKANISDVQKRLVDLTRFIDQKADAHEVDEKLDRKANMSDIIPILDRKADVVEVRNALEQKADVTAMVVELRSKASTVDIASELEKKMDRAEAMVALNFKASISEVQRMLENKASANEYSTLLEQVSRSMDSLRADVDAKISIREVHELLSLKANSSDMHRILDMKANSLEVSRILETKANTDDVNEALNQKANKQSVITALQKKVGKAEFDEALLMKPNITELNEILSRKADLETVTQLVQQRALKRDVVDLIESKAKDIHAELSKDISQRPTMEEVEMKVNMADVHALLSTKVSRKEFISSTQQMTDRLATQERTIEDTAKLVAQESRAMTQRLVAGLEQEMRNTIGEMKTSIAQKPDVTFVHSETQRMGERIHDEMRALTSDVQSRFQRNEQSGTKMKQDLEVSARSIAESCCAQLSREVQSALKEKTDISVCRDLIASSTSLLKQTVDAITSEINDVRRDLSIHQRDITELATTKSSIADVNVALSKKADKTTMLSLLSEKPDSDRLYIEQIGRLLERKANISDVEVVLKRKADTEEVVRLLELKANLVELRNKADSDEVDELRQIISTKPDIKDVCTLLDQKVNITDINKALSDVNQELEARALVEDLHKVLRAQAAINQALCADTLLGRWLWKSGKLKTGNLIPWNVQSLNTSPDVFGWEKDKASITVSLAGLYEITFGFYSRKKPTIQLLVNGEPIMSSVNSASYAIHHSSGRLAHVTNHSAGNVTGLTGIDFISIPAKARIAISYTGEDVVEGFLGLRKL